MSKLFYSTRSKDLIPFEEVVFRGTCRKGGLYISPELPKIDINSLPNRYQDAAFYIIKNFLTIPDADLKKIIENSYKSFASENVLRVNNLDKNLDIIELFHGPSFAFKDFALQLLSNLYEYFLKDFKGELKAIVATSGDTGSSAITAFRENKKVKLYVLYPDQKISEFQRRQMTTHNSENVKVIAIKGSFDDCQEIIKRVQKEDNDKLISLNSVNYLRIIAQIIYYFFSYKLSGRTNYFVPTGNFGNVYAGYLAKKMRLPISLIICTNQNDILHRFFKDNSYKTGQFHQTLAPSMDIQKASNFERYLFDLIGRDQSKLEEIMLEFQKTGEIKLSKELHQKSQKDFQSFMASDEDIIEEIKFIYQKYNYVLDPHSACASFAARKLNLGSSAILATADPKKFRNIYDKLSIKLEEKKEEKKLFSLSENYEIMANDYELVRNYIYSENL